jgi:hypothetical protein
VQQEAKKVEPILGELDGFLARCQQAGAVVPPGLEPLGQPPALEDGNQEEERKRWVERRDAYARVGMVSDLNFTCMMILLIAKLNGVAHYLPVFNQILMLSE